VCSLHLKSLILNNNDFTIVNYFTTQITLTTTDTNCTNNYFNDLTGKGMRLREVETLNSSAEGIKK